MRKTQGSDIRSIYEDLIGIMQEEGEKNNPVGIQMGIMTGPYSCDIDGLSLAAEDLLFAEHLINPVAIKVKINKDGTDGSEYLEPLKEGDVVAVKRISDSQYLVLEKMVSL